ncbi:MULTISPECIES: CDGSH iron-sulfur domain-containing protein [Paenibacillus]|uniref:CDGSH iron-sulfur domain-containing protein n=1 Tax=Paenibacillus radicis (ex Xue et al. 2023) TaxID=2972489 RepID=A0ABT1YT71_9BACL|nr:CDGSH iron-sulfur domain-containing protein [Paenibacillus radicis (ex Xue et al. 2023)]MCR8636385.1 CDGSH iron-sulfur domain-containing protein [Paenibacillus radicis (ex Xue et al. 2023)]
MSEVHVTTDVKITVADNGPLIVNGGIDLLDGEGKELATKEATYLCRCGLSSNKPFCTGAHKGKFESVVRA